MQMLVSRIVGYFETNLANLVRESLTGQGKALAAQHHQSHLS